MFSLNYDSSCNFGLGCGYNYLPCQHIEDVMKKLNIKERNEENDKKIKEYLFNNCCNRHYSKFDYLICFVKKLISENYKDRITKRNFNLVGVKYGIKL